MGERIMPTDYQRKYVESIKVYHQLHSELGRLTMKLTNSVHDLKIASKYKSTLNEIAFECADRIKDVDLKFRDLVRVKWTPPENRSELRSDELLN